VAAGTLTFAANTWTVAGAAATTIKSPVSEWGATLHTSTGGSAYDFGLLFTDVTSIPGTRTSNWYAATWRSGKGLNSTLATNPFWYKRGGIRSTHSANYDGTTATSDSGKGWKGTLSNTTSGNSTTYNKGETLDSAATTRCTYCHDVHGTHNGVNGDVAGSPDNPYLRGTWKTNPYPEDGAPRYGMANWTVQGDSATAQPPTTTNNYGFVPRASANSANSGISGLANVGGYWIDQNSGNPQAITDGTTTQVQREAIATSTSGLCEQCHGAAKTGSWTAAGINAIDQITGEGLWVSGFNGHANAVVGGSMVETGTNLQWDNTTKVGRNIFNRTVRGSLTADLTNSNKTNVDMGLASHGGSGYSYRSASGGSYGYGWIPREAQTTELGTTTGAKYGYRYFAWNNVDYNSGSSRNFTYASGSQKLYVTNTTATTTETAHNAQVNYHTFTCSKCHNPHASRLPKLMITNCLDTNHNTWEDKSTFTGTALPIAPWTGKRHSNWASAQNCHRLDSMAVNDSTVTHGNGWNKVTPWIEDATPDATKTADLTTLPAY
jgi:cytochrome c553